MDSNPRPLDPALYWPRHNRHHIEQSTFGKRQPSLIWGIVPGSRASEKRWYVFESRIDKVKDMWKPTKGVKRKKRRRQYNFRPKDEIFSRFILVLLVTIGVRVWDLHVIVSFLWHREPQSLVSPMTCFCRLCQWRLPGPDINTAPDLISAIT